MINIPLMSFVIEFNQYYLFECILTSSNLLAFYEVILYEYLDIFKIVSCYSVLDLLLPWNENAPM